MEPEISNIKINRGIAPRTLIVQVENTAAFLFDPEQTQFHQLPYVQILAEIRRTQPEPEALSHFEYFRLCVAAHWGTVATFVPTDVDNSIRLKLWNSALPLKTLAQMGDLVVESLHWNPKPLTTRGVSSPRTGEFMCGHHGEWFSIAVPAYAALKRKDPERSKKILDLILGEMEREKQIFEDLRAARDGMGVLKAATIIAHNLGDLDRVIDMWNLSDEDPLKAQAYKAGHQPTARFGNSLFAAGELNKKHMAHENHRHLPLRAARCLRRKPDFMLPLGPFFDDWGRQIARDPELTPEEIGQVAETLVVGWEKLDHPVGYARALSAIIESFPGQLNALSRYLPAKSVRILKAGTLRDQCTMSRAKFERQWTQWGLI